MYTVIRWEQEEEEKEEKKSRKSIKQPIDSQYLQGGFGNESLATLIAPMILRRRFATLHAILTDHRVVVIVITVDNDSLSQFVVDPRLVLRLLGLHAGWTIDFANRLDRVAQSANGMGNLQLLRRLWQRLPEVATISIHVRLIILRSAR